MQVWACKTWEPLKFKAEIPKTRLLSQKSQPMQTCRKNYNIHALVSQITTYAPFCQKKITTYAHFFVSKITTYSHFCRKNHNIHALGFNDGTFFMAMQCDDAMSIVFGHSLPSVRLCLLNHLDRWFF